MVNSSPLRVLITRLSHIGDCVLTLPLVCAIKDQLPNVHIAWVVEPPSDQLLADHRAIDEVVVVPRGWLKRPRDIRAVRRRIRELNVDLCIDPQSLTKSAAAAWFSGAAKRIGLERPDGRELAPALNNYLVGSAGRHLVNRTLGLLVELGITQTQPCFDLPVYEAADLEIEAFTINAHLGCEFIVINPGAGWPSKRWGPARYGQVARHLGQHYQIPSVVAYAGPRERDDAETVVKRSGGHAIMAPPTNLRELASLLRRSLFYLGGDTGPTHLAAALGKPCVALFGPTHPADCGPCGKQHIAVQAVHDQRRGKARRHDTTAIQAIEPKFVIDACERMLSAVASTASDRQAA